MPQPAPEIVGDLPDGPVEILEGDVRFLVDVAGAQKTGFYLDQSLNRAAVAVYAGGKSMLDAFCYTGGFGLHAARAGARHVVGVDSSQPAIARARENSALNGFDDVEHQEADVFEFLQARATSGDRFQLVICDPPKFARHARDLDDAIGGYVRLNQAAVRVLEPDGILATCSCSGHVDRIMFVQMLAHVAELSGRSIQILELRGQAPDHPVSVSCPESDYLKCAICRVV
jgi:23S rRNA (cytosine1962-C5)-methyltransferase